MADKWLSRCDFYFLLFRFMSPFPILDPFTIFLLQSCRIACNWSVVMAAAPAPMGIVAGGWGRRGISGFGFASTAKDVATGVVANHLTAIVTGAKLFCPFC
jgi:hypothetical protein